MLIRLEFFKIRDRPFGFLFGGRADFFQQLKLDIFETLVKFSDF